MGIETAAALAVAGGGMQAYSSFAAGQAARRAGDYQANLDRQRASQAEVIGAVQQRQSDLAYGERVAHGQTSAAARGITTGVGSIADEVVSAARMHAEDKAAISANAGSQEWGYLAGADMAQYGGRMAARGGTMDAIGSMLATGGKIGGMENQYNPPGTGGDAPTLVH